MKKIEILEKFCEQMLQGSAKVKSFGEICRSIGVRTSKVDACLRESLGVGGVTVVECFRRDIPLSELMWAVKPAISSQPR